MDRPVAQEKVRLSIDTSEDERDAKRKRSRCASRSSGSRAMGERRGRDVDQPRKGMEGVGEAGDLPNVRQNGRHSTMHCSCDVVECDKGKESFRHGKTLDVPASADHEPRKAV